MSAIKPTADEIRVIPTETGRVSARVDFPRGEAYISQVSFAVGKEPTVAEILHAFDWKAQHQPKPEPEQAEVPAS